MHHFQSTLAETSRRSAMASLLCFVVFVGSASANPSNTNPNTLMPVHLTEHTAAVHKDAAARHADVVALLTKITKLFQEKKIGSVAPKEWIRCFTQLGYLKYRAKQLEAFGETAGYNLGLRHYQLEQTYGSMLQTYKQTAQYQPLLARARASLAKYDKALAREKGKIDQLLKAGQIDQAWEALLSAQFETMGEPVTMLLQSPERYAIIGAYTTETDIAKLWTQRGNEALIAQRDKYLPKYDEILRQLGDAARGVGAMGTAEVNGQLVEGPAVVTQCHVIWRQVHIGALRACYVEYARVPVNQKAAANYQKMVAAYKAFCGQYVERVAAIVNADATRVPTSQAAARRQAYVPVLGLLALDLQDEALKDPLQKALAGFALKSPEVAAKLAAYQDATGEQLRWLKRVAAAEKQRAVKEIAPLKVQLANASLSNATLPALFNPKYPKTAELRTEASVMLRVIAPLVVNKAASIESGAKASPQAASMIGRYDNRVYCILSDASAWLAPQQQRLAQTLFVDGEHPPQTLEAAGAIASLGHGYFDAAGGIVTGCHIESMTTRLATLPVGAHPFIRLGPFEVEPAGENHSLKQLLVRCDLQTKWLATPYVFVQAP